MREESNKGPQNRPKYILQQKKCCGWEEPAAYVSNMSYLGTGTGMVLFLTLKFLGLSKITIYLCKTSRMLRNQVGRVLCNTLLIDNGVGEGAFLSVGFYITNHCPKIA